MSLIMSRLKKICFMMFFGLQACAHDAAEPETQASQPASSAQFEQAVLREGQAFADWSLNAVTYREVMAKLGPSAYVAKSEVSESSCNPYPNCRDEKYTRVRVSEGEFTFFFEHLKPGGALDELRLEGVKVDCYEACGFKGVTGKGIRIGDSQEKVKQVYGDDSFSSKEWQASCYRSGICFSFEARGETPKLYAILILLPDKLKLNAP